MRYLRETLAVEILCVFFFISKTEAIKCYQCDSSDPGCSSLTIADVNSTYLMECGSEHPKPFCRKTIQTILDSNNLVRITRTCGWLTKSRNDTKCYKQDTQFKFDTTCQCHTDGCNAAPSVFAGTTFGVLVSATLINLVMGASHCFVCNTPYDQYCEDTFDVTSGKSYDCSRLQYTSNSVLPRILTDIISEERAVNTNTTYICIKLTLEYSNSTEGITRSCFPQPASIDDSCDFIEKEIKGAKVKSCHFCDGQDCNSATGMHVSIPLVAFASYLMYLVG